MGTKGGQSCRSGFNWVRATGTGTGDPERRNRRKKPRIKRSLSAPYSLLSISNMLCDASFLPWGGGGQGVKVTYMDFKISRRASEPNIRSTWDSNP